MDGSLEFIYLSASTQIGWIRLVAKILQFYGPLDGEQPLKGAKPGSHAEVRLQ